MIYLFYRKHFIKDYFIIEFQFIILNISNNFISNLVLKYPNYL